MYYLEKLSLTDKTVKIPFFNDKNVPNADTLKFINFQFFLYFYDIDINN